MRLIIYRVVITAVLNDFLSKLERCSYTLILNFQCPEACCTGNTSVTPVLPSLGNTGVTNNGCEWDRQQRP